MTPRFVRVSTALALIIVDIDSRVWTSSAGEEVDLNPMGTPVSQRSLSGPGGLHFCPMSCFLCACLSNSAMTAIWYLGQVVYVVSGVDRRRLCTNRT
ncbi:hypothetical protein CC79DRAFT_183784 [Sarocladium strictum]